MTRLTFPSSPSTRLSPSKALAQGMSLSRMYGMPISPADVARLLTNARVKFVIVGAHAINLYTGRPRATQDVDVVTAAPAKARRAVEQAYPHLSVEDHPVVIRFKEGGHEVLDLIKAGSAKLFRRVLELTTSVEIEGVSVAIPNYEAALALKFYSMTSRGRASDDRMQDAVDFSRAAKARERVNRTLLTELGELSFVGGGEALNKLVDDARAGRRIDT